MSNVTFTPAQISRLIAAGIDLNEFFADPLAVPSLEETAPVTAPADAPVETTPVTPAADAPVLYRNAKAKAAGKAQADAIWARHYAAAGVKTFKALTPAQQKAAKAEVAAAWKAVPGTRKTKLA